ncbi:unnamed protein product [Brassicogethes aeneus]|uniref:Uncharacterized protein n=1 Tax=Brassicogethes aeneus TaxID=1431903 RepID=A0A9P0FFQ0_BRAAE|nr:unnamed protein product [Brassicogethes aeneus]
MELSDDLVTVQGILVGLMRNTGEFTRINHRGGNEDRILNVVIEMEKFLSSKNYVKKNKINKTFTKEVEDIVMFLTINTNFKHHLSLEGYSHLTNIMPQLSKCLLSNIVYGLDLCQSLCAVMKKLPLNIVIELLEEMVICLKKSDPKVHLEYAFMFLTCVSEILYSTTYNNENEEFIEKINEVTNIILYNLTGLYSDKMKTWKVEKIYEHMGYSLIKLFDLLLYCEKDNILHRQFLENILKTSCAILKNVTIDVYCTWAEIEEDDQSLQNKIAIQGYSVLESFQKYSAAKELVTILANLARKPKSLSEQIHEADLKTTIKKVNKEDADQKYWFKALLNTQVFKDKDTIECAKKWAHLSSADDVSRLLDLSVLGCDDNGKELIIKCASVLSAEDLILTITRHFYKNGSNHILNDNINNQMVLLFNKFKRMEKDGCIKDIALLVLQNPKQLFAYIYKECIKDQYYSELLKECFISLKEISQIEKIGFNIFNEIYNESSLNEQNVNNFAVLLNMLLDIKYFTDNTVVTQFFYVHLNTNVALDENNNVLHLLQLFNDLKIKIQLNESIKGFIKLLLDIMGKSRCRFLDFNLLKQSIVKCVVEILNNHCDYYMNQIFKVELSENADKFVIFYYTRLTRDNSVSFLSQLYPNFDDKLSAIATKLIQHCMQLQAEPEVEKYVAVNICRAVKKFPEVNKSEDGLNLISIITERSLKSLANDKEFVCQLVHINDQKICQTLAQRMLS